MNRIKLETDTGQEYYWLKELTMRLENHKRFAAMLIHQDIPDPINKEEGDILDIVEASPLDLEPHILPLLQGYDDLIEVIVERFRNLKEEATEKMEP